MTGDGEAVVTNGATVSPEPEPDHRPVFGPDPSESLTIDHHLIVDPYELEAAMAKLPKPIKTGTRSAPQGKMF
tara:strand:+ start:211 stop:429 length:219 start_codon:yes stop_codon:yes gene_type:complete